jgi:hypothetical protein
MDRSSFHTSIGVVLYDGKPQSVLSQETAELITEQVIRGFARSDCHVISQNGHHRSAKGNDLNFAILCVSEDNLLSAQVYILILNVANCGSPTTAVEQKIDDDPVAILAEVAVCFRLPQERHEFIVCVSFLHSFRSLVDFEIGFGVALFVTPREEDLQSPSVTVDRTVGQAIFTHLQNHLIKVFGTY